ncbi:ATP-binding protein [Desulfallas sp. Bu1-1]|uniref:ATP-binding protein n=1 Tax=Desulfallas sp. Bu1-1 TaxID=2787620 RepID=UPI0018A11191|nr:ATP-binding protein [Desulfallas sp. Bu1-1]
MKDRYQLRSIIIASQLPLENWHGVLPDPMVTDVILDWKSTERLIVDQLGDLNRNRWSFRLEYITISGNGSATVATIQK